MGGYSEWSGYTLLQWSHFLVTSPNTVTIVDVGGASAYKAVNQPRHGIQKGAWKKWILIQVLMGGYRTEKNCHKTAHPSGHVSGLTDESGQMLGKQS